MIDKVVVDRTSLLRMFYKHTNIMQLNSLVEEMVDMIISKNNDYGDAWQRYGIFTPLIRLNDKLLRVETLVGGKPSLVADESIKDTIRDIVGYAILALLWMDRFMMVTDDSTSAGKQLSFESLKDFYAGADPGAKEGSHTVFSFYIHEQYPCDHKIMRWGEDGNIICALCEDVITLVKDEA